MEKLFNDTEKEQLNKFVNDERLVEIVKKVVLSAVYFEGTLQSDKPLENFCLAFAATNLTQEQKGEKLDAALLAVQLLNDGFARLQRFNKKNKDKQEGERSNPAR